MYINNINNILILIKKEFKYKSVNLYLYINTFFFLESKFIG